MSKITIADVAEALQAAKIDSAAQRQIIEALNHKAEEAQEEHKGEALPKGKRQYVMLLSDPNNKVASLGDLTGWVIQIEEGRPPVAILDDIRHAARDYNSRSPKAKHRPVRSVGEAIEVVPRRYWLAQDGTKVLPKTKTPVQIVITDNKL